MRKAVRILSGIALVLAGASATADSKIGSVVNRQSAFSAMGLRTGGWHTTIKYLDAQLLPVQSNGQVSEAALAALKAKVGTQVETDDCIGDGLAQNGDLILPGVTVAKNCAIQRMVARSGRLEMSSSCGNVGNSLNFIATYTPRTVDGKIALTALSSGVVMKLSLSTTSRYAGQCRLKQVQPNQPR